MLFMVIEHFKDRNPAPIYKRFAEQGRIAPDGLKYVGSWIEVGFNRCFQLMECDDAVLFQEWMNNWRDIVDFDVIPVVTSAEMVKLFESSQ